MTQWMYSISKISNWDLDSGTPVPIAGNASGSALYYDTLQCRPLIKKMQFNCNGHIFDLKSGEVDGQLVLDGVVRTNSGKQVGGMGFPGSQPNVIQIAESKKGKKTYLLHRKLFRSSFNQLFHLGRHDHSMFELIYDDYPHARIFKIKSD